MTDIRFPHPEYERTVLQPAYADAAAYLFAPMLAAHEAHAVMLAECGIITPANARALLQAVAQVRFEGMDHLGYKPGVEDLFFRVEARIIELAGPDDGGNLQLARSRNDLGQALARMALRPLLIDLYADLERLRRTRPESCKSKRGKQSPLARRLPLGGSEPPAPASVSNWSPLWPGG